jgi:hypothetical protein
MNITVHYRVTATAYKNDIKRISLLRFLGLQHVIAECMPIYWLKAQRARRGDEALSMPWTMIGQGCL